MFVSARYTASNSWEFPRVPWSHGIPTGMGVNNAFIQKGSGNDRLECEGMAMLLSLKFPMIVVVHVSYFVVIPRLLLDFCSVGPVSITIHINGVL